MKNGGVPDSRAGSVRKVKYVKVVEEDFDGSPGFFLDHRPYLKELTELAPQLPSGARGFVTDPEHYDYSGRRCIKDLNLRDYRAFGAGGIMDVRFKFDGNQYKHDEGLAISYRSVIEFQLQIYPEPKAPPLGHMGLGDLQLDEILPHAHGCTHEIQFTGGHLYIVAADLAARWGDEVGDQ